MPGVMSESDLMMLGVSGLRRDSSSLGQQSLLQAMNDFVTAVEEMDAAVMIPCKLQDMTPSSSSTPSPPAGPGGSSSPQSGGVKSLIPAQSASKSLDMFTYFTMLNAIKSELVQGPPRDEGEAGETDDISQQTAVAFRHHLRGLFDVLRQMTSHAELLTTTYKDEVGDTSPNMTSQTRSLSHYSL